MHERFRKIFFVLVPFVLMACQLFYGISETPEPFTDSTPLSLPVEITDPTGVTMRLIPAGDFIMGSDDDVSKVASPAHTVTLPAYYMDVYEVTRRLYQQCVQAEACEEVENVPSVESYYKDSEYPMIATWDHANAFCQWRGARLPSEAEWEKAARGTDGRQYPWGDEYDLSYVQTETGGPHLVGVFEKGKSPYGMYDMAGNLWEWTSDKYLPYPGYQGDQSNFHAESYVLRGGSWLDPDATSLSTWFRYAEAPISTEAGYIGFRCAKDAP